MLQRVVRLEIQVSGQIVYTILKVFKTPDSLSKKKLKCSQPKVKIFYKGSNQG